MSPPATRSAGWLWHRKRKIWPSLGAPSRRSSLQDRRFCARTAENAEWRAAKKTCLFGVIVRCQVNRADAKEQMQGSDYKILIQRILSSKEKQICIPGVGIFRLGGEGTAADKVQWSAVPTLRLLPRCASQELFYTRCGTADSWFLRSRMWELGCPALDREIALFRLIPIAMVMRSCSSFRQYVPSDSFFDPEHPVPQKAACLIP